MKKELESPPNGISIVTGPALDIGPSRKLENDRRALLVELGVDKTAERTTYEVVLLLMLELLILLGFALRISFYLLATEADPGEQEDPALHILAVVNNMVVLPHLLLLAVHRDGWVNQSLKFFLSLVALVISIISLALDDHPNYTAMAVALSVFTFIFLLTTILRVLLNTRLRKYIVRIRFVGAILEELSSKGSQSLQLLVLVIILIGAIRNRNKEAFQHYFAVSRQEHTVRERAALIILDTVASVITMIFVMLFFWLYARVHYRKTHERRVAEDILEEKLESLAESNKETLLQDTHVSLTRYRPITKDGNVPVISFSRREGREM